MRASLRTLRRYRIHLHLDVDNLTYVDTLSSIEVSEVSENSLICNLTYIVKYGAQVLGKLFDSRTLYIASLTIVKRAGNAMTQIKYAKKY